MHRPGPMGLHIDRPIQAAMSEFPCQGGETFLCGFGRISGRDNVFYYKWNEGLVCSGGIGFNSVCFATGGYERNYAPAADVQGSPRLHAFAVVADDGLLCQHAGRCPAFPVLEKCSQVVASAVVRSSFRKHSFGHAAGF